MTDGARINWWLGPNPNLAAWTDAKLRKACTRTGWRIDDLYHRGMDGDDFARQECDEAGEARDLIIAELDRRAVQSNHERIMEAARYGREPSRFVAGMAYDDEHDEVAA